MQKKTQRTSQRKARTNERGVNGTGGSRKGRKRSGTKGSGEKLHQRREEKQIKKIGGIETYRNSKSQIKRQ